MKKSHLQHALLLYVICVAESLFLIAYSAAWVGSRIMVSMSNPRDTVNRVTVVNYPEQLVYVLGIDTELKLDGLTVAYAKYGDYVTENDLYEIGSQYVTVDTSRVDLTTPGVYEAYIVLFDTCCILPIEVIDLQQYAAVEGVEHR